MGRNIKNKKRVFLQRYLSDPKYKEHFSWMLTWKSLLYFGSWWYWQLRSRYLRAAVVPGSPLRGNAVQVVKRVNPTRSSSPAVRDGVAQEAHTLRLPPARTRIQTSRELRSLSTWAGGCCCSSASVMVSQFPVYCCRGVTICVFNISGFLARHSASGLSGDRKIQLLYTPTHV